MEFEHKEYYNDDLQKKLNKKITKSKYGELKLIIDEYFQRRSYEFNEFSDYDVDKEIDNFTKKVRTVKYDPKFKMLAAYKKFNFGPGKLIFNINQIGNLTPEEVMEAFFHEINHVVNDRGGINQGIINEMTISQLVKHEIDLALNRETVDLNSYGRGLDEIFTEATALRLVFGGNAEDYQINGVGYPTISFASSMLSAAIGMSEKELIYASNQPREKFLQKVFDNFPKENQEQAQAAFYKFERKMNDIYERMYLSSAGNTVQASDIGILIKNAYEIAKIQISSDSKNNMSSEKMASYIYRTSRMEQIAKKEVAKIIEVTKLKPESASQIEKHYEKSQKETTDFVYDLYKKNPEHTNITQEQYRSEIERKEFDSGKQWDNSIALQLDTLIKNKERTGLLNNGINVIRNMFQRYRTPKLEPAKKNQIYLENTMEQYEVTVPGLTKEQIDKILSKNENQRDSINRSSPSIDDDL